MSCNSRVILSGILTLLLCAVSGTSAAEQVTYYSEDWESGAGLWSASNGVWEVGNPTAACEAFEGTNVAGTDLASTYPRNANSRLESIAIDLPGLVCARLEGLRLAHAVWQ